MTSAAHSPARLSPTMLLGAALGLAMLFWCMRAWALFGPASARPLLPLSFVLMAAAAWLLFDGTGRRQLGFTRPGGPAPYWRAVASGVLAAALCGALGLLLFGRSSDNWFISVARSFQASAPALPSAWALFAVFALPAVTFSPVGEEIFFRGVLQHALEGWLPNRTSAWVESGLFGLVHLLHHGLAYAVATGGWQVMPVSGAIWVLLMTLLARWLAHLRMASGSLYPAMLCHAVFNVTMGGFIFGALWPPA